jgi:hypothetical protein
MTVPPPADTTAHTAAAVAAAVAVKEGAEEEGAVTEVAGRVAGAEEIRKRGTTSSRGTEAEAEAGITKTRGTETATGELHSNSLPASCSIMRSSPG